MAVFPNALRNKPVLLSAAGPRAPPPALVLGRPCSSVGLRQSLRRGAELQKQRLLFLLVAERGFSVRSRFLAGYVHRGAGTAVPQQSTWGAARGPLLGVPTKALVPVSPPRSREGHGWAGPCCGGQSFGTGRRLCRAGTGCRGDHRDPCPLIYHPLGASSLPSSLCEKIHTL